MKLSEKDIYIFGKRKKPSHTIALAMIQSLSRKNELPELLKAYPHIILDECHHIPATSFEAVLKQIPARFILGLTATPYRKDGLETIAFQQCGPIRHTMKECSTSPLSKKVEVFETTFQYEILEKSVFSYHDLLSQLIKNPIRNDLIVRQAIFALSQSRFPLLISDRKEHLEQLRTLINDSIQSSENSSTIILLEGPLTSKKRNQTLEQLSNLRKQGKRVILLSTSSLIGEGFDLPALDTLILATPLSFKGRIVQTAGRIHRIAEDKTSARILDFKDPSHPILLKMFRNRIRTYQDMGYEIVESKSLF